MQSMKKIVLASAAALTLAIGGISMPSAADARGGHGGGGHGGGGHGGHGGGHFGGGGHGGAHFGGRGFGGGRHYGGRGYRYGGARFYGGGYGYRPWCTPLRRLEGLCYRPYGY